MADWTAKKAFEPAPKEVTSTTTRKAGEPKRHRHRRHHHSRVKESTNMNTKAVDDALKRHLRVVHSCLNRNPQESRVGPSGQAERRVTQRVGVIQNGKESEPVMRNATEPVRQKVLQDLDRITAINHAETERFVPRIRPNQRDEEQRPTRAEKHQQEHQLQSPRNFRSKQKRESHVVRSSTSQPKVSAPEPKQNHPSNISRWSEGTVGGDSNPESAEDKEEEFVKFTDEQLDEMVAGVVQSLPRLSYKSTLSYNQWLLATLFERLVVNNPALKEFTREGKKSTSRRPPEPEFKLHMEQTDAFLTPFLQRQPNYDFEPRPQQPVSPACSMFSEHFVDFDDDEFMEGFSLFTNAMPWTNDINDSPVADFNSQPFSVVTDDLLNTTQPFSVFSTPKSVINGFPMTESPEMQWNYSTPLNAERPRFYLGSEPPWQTPGNSVFDESMDQESGFGFLGLTGEVESPFFKF